MTFFSNLLLSTSIGTVAGNSSFVIEYMGCAVVYSLEQLCSQYSAAVFLHAVFVIAG
jgi:hypothetical protein